jgi:hypothetical protein
MKSPAHDLALHLAGLGIGTFGADSGWSINVSTEPAEPDTVITLYDTGGDEPDTDELDLLRPTFQVRVRGDDYPVVYSKQEAIRDALILPGRIETADSVFLGIFMTSDILAIGRDDNDRHLLTANYRSIRERV